MHTDSRSHELTRSARPAGWRLWLSVIRPATLPAGAVPVVVGTAVAAGTLGWRPGVALAALLVALGLQIGSNLVNDAADFVHGADDERRLGPARAAQRGWLTPRQLAAGAAVAFAVALALGMWLATIGGWPVIAVGLVALLAAIAYTAGPVPLGYLGLGDVLVFIFFGPVAVVGTAWLQTGDASDAAVLASIPVGLLSTAILVVNNLRDRHTDAEAGKRTFAVRFGERATRAFYVILVATALTLPVVGVALGLVPAGWLVSLGALPFAALCVRALTRVDGAALNPWLGRTARLLLVHGALLAVGATL
ncbi:MAG: 1,4-dihydroxy-2-naphthoate polyprenyltransferase [Deltaproteobacteria bacterium]|nr:MAG: 1,4-dihydroxy-2-naphthoate polyprenyltransferase [Deltaproteobacteria bacterium]